MILNTVYLRILFFICGTCRLRLLNVCGLSHLFQCFVLFNKITVIFLQSTYCFHIIKCGCVHISNWMRETCEACAPSVMKSDCYWRKAKEKLAWRIQKCSLKLQYSSISCNTSALEQALWVHVYCLLQINFSAVHLLWYQGNAHRIFHFRTTLFDWSLQSFNTYRKYATYTLHSWQLRRMYSTYMLQMKSLCQDICYINVHCIQNSSCFTALFYNTPTFQQLVWGVLAYFFPLQYI